MPSVVNIFTSKNVQMRDPWAGFYGQPYYRGDTVARANSLGTGFVIQAKGHEGLILTNHHVIAGADDIKVKFTESADESEVAAEVIGRDPELDIALLKVKTNRELTPATLGDSDQLKVGEWIAAIGNPFGHGHSVTHGIVSAKERALPEGFGRYLQVDAPINPGNSGGPLVNLKGEVVGINNAIDARGPGIGFAIPINAVKEMLPQLESQGHVQRGFIGVSLMATPEGAPLVAAVVPGHPAAKAGLHPYDVISKVNGRNIKSAEELTEAVMKTPVGKKIQTEVIRGGKTMTLEILIAPRPES
jgi:serine protease Do